MTYEELLTKADHEGLVVKEKSLRGNDGRIRGRKIAIRNTIDTQKKKSCVLAEELGHYYTTVGDILDQSSVENRKQELRARYWAYNKMIGLIGIVKAYEHGCQNASEMAEYLNVTEDFLHETICQYRSKYGVCAEIDNYIIFFIPNLRVMKRISD